MFNIYLFLPPDSQKRTKQKILIKPHKKSAGIRTFAHPANQGLRIAFQPRISNAEAHAMRIL